MPTLDLTRASSLSSLTMMVGARDFPVRLSTLLRHVLPTLPSESRPLQELIVVLDKGKNTLALRDAWKILWPVIVGPFANLQQDYDHIVLRAQYPLAWDQHLIEGVQPLRDVLPLRLEFTTSSGDIHPCDGP